MTACRELSQQAVLKLFAFVGGEKAEQVGGRILEIGTYGNGNAVCALRNQNLTLKNGDVRCGFLQL